MLNTKRILMVVTATVLGLGLSGCGKDNYNGSYTGTEIKTPSTSQSGGYNAYMGAQSYRGVSAELSHNGEIVTGTYTITQSTYGTTSTGATESYRFEANASQSDQLTAVRLIPMTTYGSVGCVLEGSLSAVENGRRITGTLNPTTTQFMGSAACMPTQITLDRTN